MKKTKLQPIIYKDSWHKKLADYLYKSIKELVFDELLSIAKSDDKRAYEDNQNKDINWIFFYGTLKNSRILDRVIKRQANEIPDRLLAHKLLTYTTNEGKNYHSIAPSDNEIVFGNRIRISHEDLKKLDAWEDEYNRKIVTLASGFNTWIYELDPKYIVKKNSRQDNAIKTDILKKALEDGTITFADGKFRGKLWAQVSKEIKSLGAVMIRNQWELHPSKLPLELKIAIATNAAAIVILKSQIDKLFEKIILNTPNFISNMTMANLGIENMNRISKEFKTTVRTKLAVQPKLDTIGMEKIAKDYLHTMELPIRLDLSRDFETKVRKSFENFSYDVVKNLRYDLEEKILDGEPRTEIQRFIAARLNVSKDRSIFIARQETALLTTKFKKSQYQQFGIDKYEWQTRGDHKVRKRHVELDGQTIDWDHPPIVDEKTGRRAHSGEDFNCRCVAVPIVEW